MEQRPEPSSVDHKDYDDARALIEAQALAEIEEWAESEGWSEQQVQEKYQEWLDKWWAD